METKLLLVGLQHFRKLTSANNYNQDHKDQNDNNKLVYPEIFLAELNFLKSFGLSHVNSYKKARLAPVYCFSNTKLHY